MKRKILNSKGFSVIEVLVVAIIISIVIAGSYTILSSGESAWFTAEANIEVNENLRAVMTRLVSELQESGSDLNGVMQVVINDGGGVSGSDIILFSIPIVCEAAGSVIDNSGDVANWGAPLTWGCTDSACMDADDDCTSRDYFRIEYRLNNSEQLVRRVLDAGLVLVREDIFAHNITDFQSSLSGDQNVVTLTVTAQKNSALNRLMSSTRTADVYLRNRG